VTLKLRDKLILSFLIVTVLSIIVTGFLANRSILKQFNSYLEIRQQEYSSDLVKALVEVYEHKGEWNPRMGNLVVRSGLREGYKVRLLDQNKKLIWGSLNGKHKNNLGSLHKKEMLEALGAESYLPKLYPIKSSGEVIGYLEVGYLRRGIFAGQDKAFIQALNKSLNLSAVIGIIFALFMSLFVSSNLSQPISRLVGIAEKIRDGDLAARFQGSTSTKELDNLSQSLNSLGRSLEKQEMLRRRLTADLAHELRTPLATLQSHLEALIDGIWQPTNEKLDSCHQEVVRLSRLVASLEQLNQLEHRVLVANLEELELKPLLQAIITNFAPQYEGKEISLDFICPNNPSVLLDRDKFTQVMINLLSNAWKFTPMGGRVTVEVQKKKDQVTIKVQDTGEGIAPEDLPHIFQRLYRGEKSRSRETGGVGIGLAIAKALVEAQGGRVRVESQLGKGSTFTLLFPRI